MALVSGLRVGAGAGGRGGAPVRGLDALAGGELAGMRRSAPQPLGAEDPVRGGTILAGPPPVYRCPGPVLGDVAQADLGEQLVQPASRVRARPGSLCARLAPRTTRNLALRWLAVGRLENCGPEIFAWVRVPAS